jgi:hypothetical protein
MQRQTPFLVVIGDVEGVGSGPDTARFIVAHALS